MPAKLLQRKCYWCLNESQHRWYVDTDDQIVAFIVRVEVWWKLAKPHTTRSGPDTREVDPGRHQHAPWAKETSSVLRSWVLLIQHWKYDKPFPVLKGIV